MFLIATASFEQYLCRIELIRILMDGWYRWKKVLVKVVTKVIIGVII